MIKSNLLILALSLTSLCTFSQNVPSDPTKEKASELTLAAISFVDRFGTFTDFRSEHPTTGLKEILGMTTYLQEGFYQCEKKYAEPYHEATLKIEAELEKIIGHSPESKIGKAFYEGEVCQSVFNKDHSMKDIFKLMKDGIVHRNLPGKFVGLYEKCVMGLADNAETMMYKMMVRMIRKGVLDKDHEDWKDSKAVQDTKAFRIFAETHFNNVRTEINVLAATVAGVCTYKDDHQKTLDISKALRLKFEEQRELMHLHYKQYYQVETRKENSDYEYASSEIFGGSRDPSSDSLKPPSKRIKENRIGI